MIEYLFLYGTLMDNNYKELELVGNKEIQGFELRNVGPFPALVDGNGIVRGQLYRIEDQSILNRTDAIEGYDPEDHNSSQNLYTRESLVLGEGLAYVYMFNQPWEHLPIIETGDWRNPHDNPAA